jgi:sulfatase maturation enzyme AslB (radical SAM superfamily)
MISITKWKQILTSTETGERLRSELSDLYKITTPTVAEVVLQSHCPKSCQHCIYPPDYHIHNKNLESETWLAGLHNLYQRFDIRRYIFSGRHVGTKELKIISDFKSEHHDAQVGLIVDGVNLSENIDSIIELQPDWLDISIDGPEPVHDKQRNQIGDYKRTLQALDVIVRKSEINIINVLTCLTTINLNSVADMIIELNQKGLKNFFMSPVVVVKDLRPQSELEITNRALSDFLSNILDLSEKLDDAWLEISVYEPKDLAALIPKIHKLPEGPLYKEYFVEWIKPGPNEVHVVYYPASLAGVAEIIVNSDGAIILPRVVAYGKIPSRYNLGSITELSGDSAIDQFQAYQDNAIDFYYERLMSEKKHLNGIEL